jgi:heat shock protein HtpX
MRGRDDDRRGGGGLGFFAHYMLISLLETVLMCLSMPLIYYFSRHRELRADYGSAKISGKESMIHALESLKRCTDLVDNRQTSVAAFKINGRAPGLLAKLFSSHPPLDVRIAALRDARNI